MTDPQKIAVLGATSAIAEQVARRYARDGAKLFLAGRDSDRLDEIAADLKVRGASNVATWVTDFDRSEFDNDLFAAMEAELGDIDLALVAFGTMHDQVETQKVADIAVAEVMTNLVSPVRLVTELVNCMAEQQRGTIAVITSVSGDRGRMSNYVYGAAKGGLSRFLQGLRHRLSTTSLQIVDVRPGMIDTPMTANFAKGFLWTSPSKVASDIERAVRKKRSVVYTPGYWRWIMLTLCLLPEVVFHRTKL